jgi:Tol biopolymer transport system component
MTDNVIPDFDPYYAPDGRQIAWLARTDPSGVMGAWNIMSMSSDGSEQRNVTNDGQINSKPAWSTDGQLIYFHRFDSTRANRWQIFSVRPDGTALREIAPGAPGNNEYPSN